MEYLYLVSFKINPKLTNNPVFVFRYKRFSFAKFKNFFRPIFTISKIRTDRGDKDIVISIPSQDQLISQKSDFNDEDSEIKISPNYLDVDNYSDDVDNFNTEF